MCGARDLDILNQSFEGVVFQRIPINRYYDIQSKYSTFKAYSLGEMLPGEDMMMHVMDEPMRSSHGFNKWNTELDRALNDMKKRWLSLNSPN